MNAIAESVSRDRPNWLIGQGQGQGREAEDLGMAGNADVVGGTKEEKVRCEVGENINCHSRCLLGKC